jgi:hypothetical protein
VGALVAGWLLLALAHPLSAATLSFLVVELGTERATPEDADSSRPGPAVSGGFESSSLWETSLFDVFFEAGHIVSNSPILWTNRISGADFPGKESPHREFPQEVRVDIETAAAGLADYFILALLTYPAGAADRKAKPEQVSLRIYAAAPARGEVPETRDYRFVYEGTSPLGILPQGGRPQVTAGKAPRGAAGTGTPLPARTEDEGEQAKRLIRGLVPHLR